MQRSSGGRKRENVVSHLTGKALGVPLLSYLIRKRLLLFLVNLSIEKNSVMLTAKSRTVLIERSPIPSQHITTWANADKLCVAGPDGVFCIGS